MCRSPGMYWATRTTCADGERDLSSKAVVRPATPAPRIIYCASSGVRPGSGVGIIRLWLWGGYSLNAISR